MANDYDDLPTRTKVLKFIVGLCPALVTWKVTGSVWDAMAVFLVGVVAGMAVSNLYIKHLSRTFRRDASGNIIAEDLQRILNQSLPVFLWAPAACGTVAAALFIWLTIPN